MKKQYNQDGIRRNITKLKYEWTVVRPVLKSTFLDWIFEPWNLHHFVDMFVETRRASPYLMGHVDSILYTGMLAWMIISLLD